MKIWNVEDDVLLQNIAGHTNVIWCLSYSPDGKYLASGSQDCTVKIWNVEDGKLLNDLKEHTNIVYCLSYSRNGKYLASGSWDKTVKIWDVENGRLFKDLTGHTDIVYCLSYSPDDKYLASGSQDCTIKIWNIENGRLLQNLKGHIAGISCISYSPDGQYLASGSSDETVKMWDVENGRLFKNLTGHTYIVECLSYSPDGQYLTSCSSDSKVKIWNAKNGKLLKNLAGYSTGPQHISYAPDGQYLALCSHDNTVKIWNAKFAPSTLIDSFINLLLTFTNFNDRSSKNLEGFTSSGRCLSYSPDGQYLASDSEDCTVKIWNVEDGKLLKDLKGHIASVSCINYSPDGQYLASGSDDTTVKIWEKRINPQSKEDIWRLTKEISLAESPLIVEDVIIEKAVISAKNQKVFEQKGAKVVNNTIDNTEDKEVSSNEGNTSKKIGNEKPHALLKDKLIAAAEQKALKLVNVKSKFIIKEPIRAEDANLSQQPTKEGVKNDKLVVNLISIKYDNPLLNNPILLKKLASDLNINLNQAIDASNYLTNLFGSRDFNHICSFDQSLLQELLGNCYEY